MVKLNTGYVGFEIELKGADESIEKANKLLDLLAKIKEELKELNKIMVKLDINPIEFQAEEARATLVDYQEKIKTQPNISSSYQNPLD